MSSFPSEFYRLRKMTGNSHIGLNDKTIEIEKNLSFWLPYLFRFFFFIIKIEAH